MNSEPKRYNNTPAGASLLHAGAKLEQARGAVIFVHGRGASAQSMLPLAESLMAQDLAYLFPQARNNTWYPYSFLSPIEQNEPHLTDALRALGGIFEYLGSAGIAPARVMIAGFSQGACLSVEYAARHPMRYGGVAALSGGLIGPPGADLNHPGSLDGTPIFLGCSDVDPHIPKERVLESEQILRKMGAQVTARLYPGMAHTVNEDELERLRAMARAL